MATVGKVIVDSLVAHGIDRVFCVPGESYLGLLDALYDSPDVDTVVCRHEGGAGFMALADARLTGRPGVAMVSRGPGASNAAIAVHTAQQDAVPFVLLVGQVAAADIRRDSFQEIDYGHMFGKIAKWTVEVLEADRIGEVMLRALNVASSGVPGPVVVVVPEDVLCLESASVPALPQSRLHAYPDPESVGRLRDLLAGAERPLVLAGSGINSADARADLLAFLEAWEMPAIVSFRRQDLLPNAHRLYAGDMGLSNPATQMAALRDADLLLVLGARLSDITTQGYSFPRIGRPEMTLVHVHADPAAIGMQFACDLALACDPRAAMAALGRPEGAPPDRSAWIGRLKAEQQAIAAVKLTEVQDGIPFERVVHIVGQNLPDDAIVTVDAGTFGAPVYRVIPFRPPQRLLAPISGAMGFGVPAAVAAALREPDRPVICFVGDGGFLMTGNELAVALERNLPLKVIVSENGIYGSIWIHQQRQYPGRIVGTTFANPDLERIGAAFGYGVTRLSSVEQLPLLPSLIAAPGPQFIIVNTSVAAIRPLERHVAE